MTDVDATLAATLDTLDDAVNYMRWIVDLARPHLRDPILELGAGHGTFTASFAEIAAVHAVEPSEVGAATLARRFEADPRVTVTQGLVDDLPARPAYGSAVMINVLEHIEDDVGALRSIAARLLPNGRVVIWVPAFQLLYSEFDHDLGHFRRYRRASLRETVERAGLAVLDVRYVNAPGFFSWLIVARLLRKRPTAGPLVTIFDRFIVPVVRRIESVVRPPFGQSILLSAEKPNTSA